MKLSKPNWTSLLSKGPRWCSFLNLVKKICPVLLYIGTLLCTGSSIRCVYIGTGEEFDKCAAISAEWAVTTKATARASVEQRPRGSGYASSATARYSSLLCLVLRSPESTSPSKIKTSVAPRAKKKRLNIWPLSTPNTSAPGHP